MMVKRPSGGFTMRQLLSLLLLLSGSASTGFAEPVPIPARAGQILSDNGWQLDCEEKIVPGTERNRAQSFDRVYYCCKLGDAKARIVFEESSTSSHLQPLRIAPDGTLFASVWPNKLLVIGPDDPPGKPGDGSPVIFPGQAKNAETVILHANASGLVVHTNDLNKNVAVYYVPLDKREPKVEKAVELCTRPANEIWRKRTGFQVTDNWIVWNAGAFEVATGKTRKRVAESGVIDDLGIDGDSIVTLRRATVNDKAICEIVSLDLESGAPKARYPVASDVRFLILRDGVAYVLNPIPFETGDREQRAEILAFDVTKPVEPLSKKKVAAPPAVAATLWIKPKGFQWNGLTVDWVKK